MEKMELTPMIKQYLSVKEKYRDAILLYRLGDFYEMFFDDAQEASKLLDLTLTSRNKNDAESVPLCGIPVVAAQNYISRLLSLGHKVAICEQLEDPKLAKGIVKRDVVKVLTPGVVIDPECLQSREGNFLAAVFSDGSGFGLASCDVSTGSFRLSEFENASLLTDEILRLEPREILLEERLKGEGWVEAIRSKSTALICCRSAKPAVESGG
jgi:DNA mismatch repair protein MutS